MPPERSFATPPFRSRIFIRKLVTIAVLGSVPLTVVFVGVSVDFLAGPGGIGSKITRIGVLLQGPALFGLIGMLFLIPDLEDCLRRSERSVLMVATLFFAVGSSLCLGLFR